MEEKNINWETISMTIISEAGTAKSTAMEALKLAKNKNFDEAKAKMKEADIFMQNASRAHFDIVKEEARGNKLEYRVLFLHAEDQLLTTQTLLLVIIELIEIYAKLFSK